jgi:hypothetical protein
MASKRDVQAQRIRCAWRQRVSWGAVLMVLHWVTINKNSWTTGKNDATLRGTGLGLAWTNAARWSAKAYIALRLGSAPVLVGDASLIRGWLEINRGF